MNPNLYYTMLKNYTIRFMLFFMCFIAPLSEAQADDNGVGQTIQIYTHFDSFLEKPSWLLVIRDIDHNENIPYVFDITKKNNFWVVFTRGRNYLITASNLQINTYKSKFNQFKKYEMKNFCQLESNGRIMKGESMFITISGDLKPYSDTLSCHASSYPDSNFTIVKPTAE